MDQYFQPPSPQPANKIKYLLMAVTGFLFLMLIIFILLSSLSKPPTKTVNLEKSKTTQSSIIPSPIKKPSLSNLQIAEKAIAWLNTMKYKDDIYYLGYQCFENKQCDQPQTDKQVGVAVLWSRFNYYKKSQKPEELTTVKQQIQSYSTTSFQPDFWHCKLLYEMQPDPTFSAAAKENLKKICLDSFYLNFVEAETQKRDVNNFISQQTITNLESNKKILTISDLLPVDEREFFMYSTYVSDFVAKYFFTNYPSNLEIAKVYFDNALSYYLNNRKTPLSSLSFLMVGALDIYKATLNKEYLNLARYLETKVEAESNKNLLTSIGLIFLQKDLYKITKDQKYLKSAQNNLAQIIDNYFDYQGYNGFRKGNRGFHNGGTAYYNYDTRNTALIISLLSTLGND